MSFCDDLADDSEAPRSMTMNGGQLVGAPEPCMCSFARELVNSRDDGDSVTLGALELLDAFDKLGPRARHVLLSIAERMARAAVTYGDDFERPADWHREAQEERLDLLVYETVAFERGDA